MTGAVEEGRTADVQHSTKPWVALAAWIGGSFAAGALGGIASTRAPEFYAELVKPDWAPPSGVFGPVWTTLYLMMAVAAWLVWREGGWRGRSGTALRLYIVQLALNALWTWLFFVWHQGAWALAEVLLLSALVAFIAILFWRVRPIAGMLLVPYLAWLLFASALTAAVWQRNPGVL